MEVIKFAIYPPGVYNVDMEEEIKKRVVHRTKIIEGQLRGLEKMIDEDVYCMDILTQGLAIQKSLASLNKLVLENHLRTHVADMMTQGDTEKAIAELTQLYELNNIRGR